MVELQKKGCWVYALSEHANTNINNVEFADHVALVVGNEADGVRKKTADKSDFLVKIPTSTSFCCLNASVSVGIGLAAVNFYRLNKQ